ncbi:MAG: hypothetical protein HOY71_28130 [Nonomuraea sp.]|nr:hypothetical protein [Nonomuraea sp.]
MTWILLSLLLGVAGVAVLVLAGFRVISAARTLSREIAEAQNSIEPRSARLRSGDGETAPPAAYDRA